MRDPASYLRRRELATESAFDRDFNFITGIERSLERAERDTENRGIELPRGVSDEVEVNGADTNNAGEGRKRKHPHQGLVKGEAGFLRGAAAGGVNVIRAPRGMSRNKQNRSRWHSKSVVFSISAVLGSMLIGTRHKCLSWTVEWITVDRTRTVRNSLETCSVAEAYDRAFPPPTQKKSEFGPPKEEDQADRKEQDDATSPSATIPTSTQTAEINPPRTSTSETVEAPTERAGRKPSSLDQTVHPHRDIYFYLHRPRTTSKKPVLAPLTPSASLTTALRSRTILEYPTIYVLPDSTAILLAEKETSPFLLEEEYLRTATPEESGAESTGLTQGSADKDGEDVSGNETFPGSSAVGLGNVDENRVMEVLKQDIFESVPG